MSTMNLLWKYFKYQLKANTKYDIHSPFIFEFVNSVLNDKRHYYAFDEIESARDALLGDKSTITVEDFGAGSRKIKSNSRVIADIAKNTLITRKFGRLLFRIAHTYKSHSILELGTSLGISALYLAKASPEGHIVTLEGSMEIAKIAERTIQKTKTDNVKVITGEFSKTLPVELEKLKIVDLAFIDGNHRKQPTIQYFEQILPYTVENSILVFDDIHWSDEMEEAWNHIKANPSVTLSFDLFFKGIIFFRKDFHERRHYQLKF